MRICIINTGGTIASCGQPLQPMPAARFAEAVARLLGPSLAAAMPDLRLDWDDGLRFPASDSGMLDSTDLRPADWCRIAGRVLDRYAMADAFVILHGTDTMDYSAAALSFLLGVWDPMGLGRAVLSKPVIVTGAQVPLFREGPDGLVLDPASDGLTNLTGALACARLSIPEVGLFFGGRLLRGNRALKISTRRFAGFDAPHLPPLAEVGIGCWHGGATPRPGPAAPHLSLDDPAARGLAAAQLHAVADGLDRHPVAQIPAFPADHRAAMPLFAQMIDAAVAGGTRTMVLEGFGEGNIPAGGGAIPAALHRAAAAGVLTVMTSRVIGGAVGTHSYAAGAWLAQAGAVSALDMTPVAALAKTAILTAAMDHHGWQPAQLRALVQRDLAGECRAADRLWPGQSLCPGGMLIATGGGARLDSTDGITLTDAADAPLWQPGAGRLAVDSAGLRLIRRDGAVTLRVATPFPDPVLILTADPDPLLALHDPTRRHQPVVVHQG